MKLTGRRVKLGLIPIGGKLSTVDSMEYTIRLRTPEGRLRQAEVYSIKKISSSIAHVDKRKIAEIFKIKTDEINRPDHGEIDILLGQQVAPLHPSRIDVVGNLVLMRNDFGYAVAGSHSKIKPTESITLSCKQARTAHVVAHSSGGIERFFDIENLGTNCNPSCGGCRCGKCQPGGKNMSLKDEKEYKLIEKNLLFDTEAGRWVASYPWIKSPAELPYNRSSVLATLKSMKKGLAKDKEKSEVYSTQIKDMLNRGAARRVTERELAAYSGPKYYISHFGVPNPKSKTTPFRIVFNSSAKFQGQSLNDSLAKGPSMLNKLLGVLLRFREGRCAFMGDISKMYHAIAIPLKEQMTHLFVWRDHDDEAPSTYAMTAVNMGDRPSATIAQIALRKSAEMSKESFPRAAEIIIESTYMDDITASTNSTKESYLLTQQIEGILKKRGFHVKEWVFSGDSVDRLVEVKEEASVEDHYGKELERVLGVNWKPDTDTLEFQVNAPQINPQTTKRIMLSVAAKVFDPLGLLTPFTVKLKILLRKVWAQEPKVGWDDHVGDTMEAEWNGTIQELRRAPRLDFPRTITPQDAVEQPTLIIFSDGSIDAYGAVAYARWEKKDGGVFETRLIAAKARVAPLKTMDITRIELCGAVLGVRLRATIQTELRMKFKKVWHITDSEIVKAMIQRESYGFNTFAANRIGEIHQTTEKGEWLWVARKPWLNVADLATRGASPTELGKSLWQSGPQFLTQPENEWPTKQQSRNDLHLPEMKQKFVGVAMKVQTESLLERFELGRFSRWRILVRTTARIIALFRRFRKGGNKDSCLEVEDLEKAEKLWILEAQKQLDLKSIQKLQPIEENGIVMVGGRTERWMQATWNKQRFILLPKDCPVTVLIANYEHKKGGHLGISSSIAKIRSRYWILGISRLMRKLIKECVFCKRKLSSTCSQIMSPLPVERLKPSPAFSNVCIDYFGPYTVRGEVQKRVRGKAYGVLLVCMGSGAIHADIASDYSTDAFLQVLRRFSSVRGWPMKIFSDPGTQLVGASKELTNQIQSLNWDQIKEYSHERGFSWKFSPGDGPWYNGVAESLVKTTKTALNAAVGESVLAFSELQTCMKEAAQLVNQRPIGVKPGYPQDGAYLCPNDLLLGRSSSKIPQGPFSQRTGHKHRFDFIQQTVSAFWKRWTQEVFPGLVLRQKWHTEKRNLKKGDVVLIQDSNEVRGRWKMGLVEEGIISLDGKVRRAKISYRTVEDGSRRMIERPVQRLILLAAVEETSAEGECSGSQLTSSLHPTEQSKTQSINA